jgi:hypothetical protein
VFELDTTGLKGMYPALVMVDFEDLNGYPFSSASIQRMSIGKTLPCRLSGIFRSGELSDKVRLPLTLRNLGTEEISAVGRIIAPRELKVPEPDFSVTIPAGGEKTLNVKLENFSATVASQHPVHALLQYERNGTNVCTSVTTMVDISDAPPAASKRFWVIVAILLAVLLGAPLLALLKGRKHAGAAARGKA